MSLAYSYSNPGLSTQCQVLSESLALTSIASCVRHMSLCKKIFSDDKSLIEFAYIFILGNYMH